MDTKSFEAFYNTWLGEEEKCPTSDDDDNNDDEYDDSYDESSDDENESGEGINSGTNGNGGDDPSAFNIKQTGSYVCWICFKKYTQCMPVKLHILFKHYEAFCTVREDPAGHLQLLLFCPKYCKYVTSEADAFSQHIATCQKTILHPKKRGFEELQENFMAEAYIELQKKIASGLTIAQLKDVISTMDHCKRKTIQEQRRTERQRNRKVNKDMNDIHSCQMCYMAFSTNVLLDRHMKRRHGAECGTTLNHNSKPNHGKTRQQLKTLIKASEKKPFQCDWCGKCFQARANLQKHERIHTLEKPYKCNECGKSFNDSSNYYKHMRLHKGKPYKCDDCDKSFINGTDLRRHKRQHSGEKLFKCKECGMSYIQSSTLKLHMIKHTGEKPFKCKECDANFRHKIQLKVHIDRIHKKIDLNPYECSVCSKSFVDVKNFNVHMRKHTGERPYKCEDCGMSYILNNYLIEHIKSACKKRKKCLKCNICGHTSKSNLNEHVLTHIEKGSLRCSACDKTLAGNQGIKKHMKTHIQIVNDDI